MPVYAQNDDFGGICDFPGVRKWTLGTTFSAKVLIFAVTFSRSERPGTSLVATCAPKRPRDQFSSILGAFWEHFGAIFDGFGIDSG